MKLKQIAPNQTELTLNGDTGDYRVLFSYETPVACQCTDGTFYRTSTKYSKTTSKHINSWLPGAQAEEKEQEFFDNLIK